MKQANEKKDKQEKTFCDIEQIVWSPFEMFKRRPDLWVRSFF